MTASEKLVAEIAIDNLAREIARQKSSLSALATAATPHEIARALYLMGWQPPANDFMRMLVRDLRNPEVLGP